MKKIARSLKVRKKQNFQSIDSKSIEFLLHQKDFLQKMSVTQPLCKFLLIASISTPNSIFEKITDKIPTMIDKRIKIVTGCGKERFEISSNFTQNPFCLSSILFPLFYNFSNILNIFTICSLYYNIFYLCSFVNIKK